MSSRTNQLIVILAVVVVVATLAILLIRDYNLQQPNSKLPTASKATAEEIGFRGSADPIPAGWTGPVFALSSDYPKTIPQETYPWETIDFKTEPEKYITTVMDYIEEGNVEVDWRIQDNKVRKWYHVPWQAYDPLTGREFIHGLTQERTSAPLDLAPEQTNPQMSYAVGFYNPIGGYTLGQVWNDHSQPSVPPSGITFNHGTVVGKILLSAAPLDQVPYLKGSYEWQANIHHSANCKTGNDPQSPDCVREIQTLRMIQFDVMVWDKRACETTCWVFGNFVYDGNLPGETPWDKLKPIGVAWGNDPEALPGSGKPLQETVIFPQAAALNEHLGCEYQHGPTPVAPDPQSRLNGPLDNPKSGCISCHSTAETPTLGTDSNGNPTTWTLVNVVPKGLCSDPEVNQQYFRNIVAGQPFSDAGTSLDYSLQLAISIQGYNNWKMKQ